MLGSNAGPGPGPGPGPGAPIVIPTGHPGGYDSPGASSSSSEEGGVGGSARQPQPTMAYSYDVGGGTGIGRRVQMPGAPFLSSRRGGPDRLAGMPAMSLPEGASSADAGGPTFGSLNDSMFQQYARARAPGSRRVQFSRMGGQAGSPIIEGNEAEQGVAFPQSLPDYRSGLARRRWDGASSGRDGTGGPSPLALDLGEGAMGDGDGDGEGFGGGGRRGGIEVGGAPPSGSLGKQSSLSAQLGELALEAPPDVAAAAAMSPGSGASPGGVGGRRDSFEAGSARSSRGSFSDAEDQQVGLGTSLTALEILSSSRQGRSIGSPSLLGGAGIGEALHPAAGAASLSPGSGEPSGEGGAHFLPDLNEGRHGQQQVPPPPDVIPYEYTEHTPAVEGGERDVREVDDDDECFDFEL